MSCFLALGVVGLPAAASGGQLQDKVRAEAQRLASAPASDLFAALMSDEVKSSLRLSDRQVNFVRRLDELIRAILKDGLLRGLDDPTPPSPSDLEKRISEDGKRARREIVAQAEEIALESILNLDQARRLRRKLDRKAASAPANRYGPYRMTGCQPVSSLSELQSELDLDREILGHGTLSYLFASMTADKSSGGG